MPWWITALENLIGGALGGMAIVFGLSKWLGTMWLEKQKARYSKELEGFKVLVVLLIVPDCGQEP
jgi:hypothetical protein